MQYHRKDLSDDQLIDIYKRLLLPRMIEEKMLLLLRQGKISKWFSGIGQEAISVGVTCALNADEWIMPLHRNLGVFTGREMPLHKLFLQWQGHPAGYSKGRERSFHFGSAAHAICGMISHLGPQLAIADGVALAHKLKEEKKVAVAFTGEGGTSEGDFHEALNLAAVWDLPVIFIIENNGYALSTPVDEQYRCRQLADKGVGYGIESVTIDGNNILSVIDTIRGVGKYCIEHQKPYLVECMTFRMRGHEEASGTKYIPQHLFETWEEKDPIKNYEKFLLESGIMNTDQAEDIRKQFKNYIDDELAIASSFNEPAFNTVDELGDIYAPATQKYLSEPMLPAPPTRSPLRFVDAISESLRQCMEADKTIIVMGQDIATYGGAFKVTAGLLEQFGKERVRNTPLCESAVIGSALGLSLKGFKAIVEMQFADFVSVGFNQIINNLAKIHYRWAQQANVVVRMPTGGGVGAGPFHSQSVEAWFVHTPGLKVVYPSNPYDAKGLLTASINDNNPVLYFEHKALYRSVADDVPEENYIIPIGKANCISEGTDITILTYGLGVHWAKNYAQEHPGISIYILDLRTLLPLDHESILIAVKQTGKVLVFHEATMTGGVGAEIAAWVAEHAFEWLDAPVLRCAALDTPVPFNKKLEDQFMAKSRLDEYIQRLLQY